MKKIIVALFCITVAFAITSKEEQILIPEDAIRFRVIANSDEIKDQQLKMEIKESVEKELNKKMVDAKNIQDARNKIQEDLDSIESIVKSYNVPYQINFGMNYFPEKEYKGINYQEGDYESLVITIGNGIGKNWWCVMFPPLCLLEAEENNLNEVEYKSYVKTFLDKYL